MNEEEKTILLKYRETIKDKVLKIKSLLEATSDDSIEQVCWLEAVRMIQEAQISALYLIADDYTRKMMRKAVEHSFNSIENSLKKIDNGDYDDFKDNEG